MLLCRSLFLETAAVRVSGSLTTSIRTPLLLFSRHTAAVAVDNATWFQLNFSILEYSMLCHTILYYIILSYKDTCFFVIVYLSPGRQLRYPAAAGAVLERRSPGILLCKVLSSSRIRVTHCSAKEQSRDLAILHYIVLVHHVSYIIQYT